MGNVGWLEHQQKLEPKPIVPTEWGKFDEYEMEFFKVDGKHCIVPTF